MKVSFKNVRKCCFQLTDGSVVFSSYLLEKDYNRLDVDVRSHRLWRFKVDQAKALSLIDKRIMKFNSQFNKKIKVS